MFLDVASLKKMRVSTAALLPMLVLFVGCEGGGGDDSGGGVGGAQITCRIDGRARSYGAAEYELVGGRYTLSGGEGNGGAGTLVLNSIAVGTYDRWSAAAFWSVDGVNYAAGSAYDALTGGGTQITVTITENAGGRISGSFAFEARCSTIGQSGSISVTDGVFRNVPEGRIGP